MPKQIKKNEVSRYVKTRGIFAIIAMTADLIFAGLLIGLLPSLITDESSVKSCLIAGGYFLFTVATLCYMVAAFVTFSKDQQYAGALFGGLFSAIAAFMSLLNLQFILALMFSGLKMEETADKIIGDKTYTEFVNAQNSNWICMIISMLIVLIIGILSVVRLTKRN